MKKFTLVTLAAVLGTGLIGCTSTANTNANMTKANMMNANSNVAVLVNSNTTMNANMGMDSNMSNRELTRDEYDRNKDKYSSEAKAAGSTIGQGAEDGWLWTKTRAALLATDGLRESTINVDVNNAVVTLRGSVGTKEQQQTAVKVAQEIEGVKSVKNMLTVKPNDSMTNQMTGGSDGDDRKTNMNANMRR